MGENSHQHSEVLSSSMILLHMVIRSQLGAFLLLTYECIDLNDITCLLVSSSHSQSPSLIY